MRKAGLLLCATASAGLVVSCSTTVKQPDFAEINSGAAISFTNSPPTAFQKTVKQAQAGDPRAQNTLGVTFGKGEGVKKDVREGARWFRRAAAQGNAAAEYNLGLY